MSSYEVSEPILNTAFDEPGKYWFIEQGSLPQCREGRRASVVFPPRDQNRAWEAVPGILAPSGEYRSGFELVMVNLVRRRVKAWREQGYPGVTRTTLELLQYWQRDGRQRRLFFAQREAAETIIFLTEARSDFLQGITVPRDEPSDERKAAGYGGFLRYACKMATGSGKTTVMAMLAAWSILNKVNNRSDGRFSDAVLVVCPNVTIRNRLRELDPKEGEASVYRTGDIVPSGQVMADLSQGNVVVTNWHIFEPQSMQIGGVSARVNKTGVRVPTRETIHIGPKNQTARGKRYLTLETLEMQRADGTIRIIAGSEERDETGNLKKVSVEADRYVESDTAMVARILDRDAKGKQNILVMNDEAHHAYRIANELPEDWDEMEEDDQERWLAERDEATVWVEGLDRINNKRGVKLCVDLSATPYFLSRVGWEANKPFPWIVSDFGLIDAIEAGLVKIPQLAVRDSTGAEVPGHFNIWQWIMGKLTPAEKGGRRTAVKPEAVLKNAGLGFAIPYLHNGQQHEYEPDFIVRLKPPAGSAVQNIILETKGFDPLEEVKSAAARRWVAAASAGSPPIA